MKQLGVLVVLSVLTNFSVRGQEVIHATRRSWASGPCCASGVNYSVQVFLRRGQVGTMEVEKVYLPERSALEGEIEMGSAMNGGLSYTITFGTYSDHGEFDGLTPDGEVMVEQKEPEEPDVREFAGEALLVLRINGRLVEVPVLSFEVQRGYAYP